MATRVFEDPDYVMEQDREVDGEERWQTIGHDGTAGGTYDRGRGRRFDLPDYFGTASDCA